ncbi:WAP four-disulfide core domain protein 8-like [Hyperolius riggenbachi]|uniref:WAP four-disulfide core domain protein 8-like n=1 Tax=Hyperolius riggenbachi TaxID=752182 RepID=UPI0035A357F6
MKGMGAALFFLLGTVMLQTGVAESDYAARPGRCPDVKVNCLVFVPDTCKTDGECKVGQKCCRGCGLACTDVVPGLTKCQKEHQEAMGSNAVGRFVPDCDKDGNYKPLQCSSSSGYCWCVTSDGEKVPGTDTRPGRPEPNCENRGIKPGTCPRFSHSHMVCSPDLLEKNRKCKNDMGCKGKQKCCLVGCQYVCKEPLV